MYLRNFKNLKEALSKIFNTDIKPEKTVGKGVIGFDTVDYSLHIWKNFNKKLTPN
jgi:hypothetical protein